MIHRPDTWVVIRIKDDDHRILGGWGGSYLNGSGWRLNSGVERVERVPGAAYDVFGHSGSVYRCFFGSYGLRMSNAGAANELIKQGAEIISDYEDAVKYLESMMK